MKDRQEATEEMELNRPDDGQDTEVVTDQRADIDEYFLALEERAENVKHALEDLR